MASTGTNLHSTSDDSLMDNPADKNASGAAAPNELLDRIVQGAHQTVDRLADTVAPHLQRMQSGAQTAGESMSAQGEQMRETADEWAEGLRDTVREHPLAAVVAAVAVGLIVARLSS